MVVFNSKTVVHDPPSFLYLDSRSFDYLAHKGDKAYRKKTVKYKRLELSEKRKSTRQMQLKSLKSLL
jgi:hypothetical protein